MRPFSQLFAGLWLSIGAAAAAQTTAAPALTIVERGDELVLELGPIDIPAHTDQDGAIDTPTRYVTVPNGGWMHGYSLELVDAKGAPVPQRLLEHAYVIAPHKRELFSPNVLYVAAASGETEPLTLPHVIGYEMRKGDSLRVNATLSDPAGKRWDGLRLRVRFPRTGARSFIGCLCISIYPFYLTVPAPARVDSAMIPPGHSDAFWEGRPAVPGRILGMSGHAPTYAVHLVFEDRTAHEVLWDARPDTNAAGQGLPIPIKKFILGVGIRPDHTYRFTVTYNNPNATPIPASGGWGVLGGVFTLERGAVWPSVSGTP